jgi:hypothetical protein
MRIETPQSSNRPRAVPSEKVLIRPFGVRPANIVRYWQMGNDKIIEQLVAVVDEMRELCAVIRQNTVLAKNNAVLLKRHTGRMNALLLEHGIEKLPDVVEENGLLVEQNVILLEQREQDVKSLLRLEQKLNEIQANHPDAGSGRSTAQAA